ncbi:MAG: DUF2089 domain-containing protein [Candidatus Sumerlaeaceae bacterium]|nr:DUF2089 domain-containing protein [Candidatus Sumerlaeaceae bacterium]
MSTPKHIISLCPFCSGELRIGKLNCHSCETQIETSLAIPPFFRLPHELQEFVLVFLRCRGSIRDVEKELGISYPTVCKKLDLVNSLLNANQVQLNPREVLERVERGEITAAEAARILRGGV